MSAAEFRALYERLRDGTGLGPQDRRGALNFLSAAQLVAAAAEVQQGRTVSLAAPVEHQASPDNPHPWVHELTHPDTGPAADRGLDFAMDRLSLNIHGNADSHIDALSHVVYDGAVYNDVVPDSWTAASAASAAGLFIDAVGQGIACRACCSTSPGCAESNGWNRASTSRLRT